MKHVAVIGSGISGLAAAYFISHRHHVTVFEKADRLGGHTHTVDVDGEGGPLALDTGFLVHNDRTYPNLVRLFAMLGVDTSESDMSFAVTCPSTGFEYSSRGMRGFFAQRRHLASPAHFKLLADILRFNREAPRVMTIEAAEGWTLRDFLRHGRYDERFVDHYLAPMASAVWSASLDTIDRFPVQTLVRFMANHGMLSVGAHPTWRVVRGGSRSYIAPLTARFADAIRTGVEIRTVERTEHAVTLTFRDRPPEQFDDVVFACHGDQVLPLLADPSDSERQVFSHFTTTANEIWLHTDDSLLPTRPWARASWNYRLADERGASPTVTYHLNRLQNLNSATNYCVTLNPRSPLPADHVITRLSWRHPRVTLDSMRAQERWADVSGMRRTHYCGAYWRHGFHEDGLVSALRVARDFGAQW